MIFTVNLDQVTIIGEDFEGYIKKFDVNFIPYALSINDKVHKFITSTHFSIGSICPGHWPRWVYY